MVIYKIISQQKKAYLNISVLLLNNKMHSCCVSVWIFLTINVALIVCYNVVCSSMLIEILSVIFIIIYPVSSFDLREGHSLP